MNTRFLLPLTLATVGCANIVVAADAPQPAATPAATAPATDQAAVAQYALGYQLGREISMSARTK